ncbi:MAG: hypothetical protein M3464_06655 [Chloroflexota bacterium]|nr:hypothetical protein [Chloroflexota bacterium]
MPGMPWGPDQGARLAAMGGDLAQVSSATACQLLVKLGWRNTYMLGLLPLQPLGTGRRLVGRARTCQYLMRRGPEGAHDPIARRQSAEIVLIEQLEGGDILCIDALGMATAGIIGDILAARIQARGAVAAVINGAVRDSPYIKEVGLPVFAKSIHPSASGRELVAADFDQPINMAGVFVMPGDVLLADDEGIIAMPLDLAEYVAEHGPPKEHLELWIRGQIAAGGSVHDFYPPSPDAITKYERETGRVAPDF